MVANRKTPCNRRLGFALAILAALLAPALAQAAAGDLDRSFGRNGVVKTDAGYATSVTIDRRGRIVAAGTDFTIVRYKRNGRLDRSFGHDGVVSTPFTGGDGYTASSARSVAVDSRGRIVAAGSKCHYEDPDYYELVGCDMTLARYMSNGSLDRSFSGDGKVTAELADSSTSASSVAIDLHDRVVLVGDTGRDFALVRFKWNGSLDPSFGTGGKVSTNFAGYAAGARSVAIDSEHRIIAVGSAYDGGAGAYSFLLARYLPDGSLDPSFGYGSGWVTTDNGYASAVAIDARGRLVAAGGGDDFAGYWSFALARYNTKGVIARWFGNSGRVTTRFGDTRSAFAGSVAIDSRGRIVAVGNVDDDRTGDTAFALARYKPNGSLDRSFSDNGKVTAAFFRHSAVARAGVIDSKDRIVVAGGHTRFVVARFIGYRRR